MEWQTNAAAMGKVHCRVKTQISYKCNLDCGLTDFPCWWTFLVWQYQGHVQQMAIFFFVGGQGLKGCLAFEPAVA
jgi:hypothetical protein